MKNNVIYGLMACSLIAFISYNAVRTKTEIEVHTVEVEKIVEIEVETIVYKDRRVEALEAQYPELADYNYGSWADTNKLSFKEAFRFYRSEYGAGSVFMWHGDYYTTDYVEEV